MAKRQKIYTERRQIEKDIAKAYRQIEQLTARVIAEEAGAALYEPGSVDFKKHEENMETLFGKLERLKATRLKRLQLTMAMFDTQPLGGELAEQRVTLQRLEQ